MKLLRTTVIVVLIVIVAALAWRNAPGCRQQARDAYEKYGGWTAEARQADPVGFMEYAEQKLAQDLQVFQDTRRRLNEARQTVAAEIEKTQSLLGSADELAATFRQEYWKAEAASSYPVSVSGTDYDREQLVEQVQVILIQKANYQLLLKQLQAAAGAVEQKEPELVAQINNTRAALATLPSKKEIARVNELTGKTEELLAQVNELIDQNERLLDESPVRTVEELVAARDEATATEKPAQVDARAFLEATE